MAGVRDLAVRINDKGVKPHINAECRLNGDFNRVRNLNDDCDVPTGRLLGEGQRLNFTIGQRSMVSNLQVSDFRDNYTGKLPMDIANQIVRQVTDPQGHHENLITRFKLTYFFGLPWYRPAWSPDSQYLIYAVEQKKSPGLMKDSD